MMTRLILPFLVAFLVASAAGSALVLVRARDAHAEALNRFAALKAKADSAKAKPDSTHAAAEHGAPSVADAAHPATSDSAHAATPAAGHSPEPAAPTPLTIAPPAKGGATTAPTAPPTVATTPTPTPKPATIGTTGDGKPATSGADAAAALGAEKKLAKIFSSMTPKDAAKVLQQMDDADVRVILGHLGARQAAAVLGNFPPQRAAELSKQSLKGTTASTGGHDE